MKNWVKRAVRTFVQSAVGYVCSAIVVVDWSADRAVLKAALIGVITSAIAGGISAVMNLIDDNRKDW